MKCGSKRRKSRKTIEQDKLEALTKQQAIEEKLALFDKIVAENAKFKAQPELGSKAEKVLSQMLDAGFVQRDASGEWIPGPNAATHQGQ